MTGSVVLFSGGQDSTTSAFWMKQARPDEPLHLLTVMYGQRHGAGELRAAMEIERILKPTRHVVFELGSLGQLAPSALTDLSKEISLQGPRGLPTTFVPGRNAVFLSLAASYLGARGLERIVVGCSEADYSGYPDCRAYFLGKMESALAEGLLRSVPIVAPLIDLSKASTVRLARTLGADCWQALGRSVTCYEGSRPGCGACPACVLRVRGFSEAGEVDPALLAGNA